MIRGCSGCMRRTRHTYQGHALNGWLLLCCTHCGSHDEYPPRLSLPRGCTGLPPRVYGAVITAQRLLCASDGWHITDQWWTAHPVRRDYRVVNGQVIYRQDGGPWRPHPGTTTTTREEA